MKGSWVPAVSGHQGVGALAKALKKTWAWAEDKVWGYKQLPDGQ